MKNNITFVESVIVYNALIIKFLKPSQVTKRILFIYCDFVIKTNQVCDFKINRKLLEEIVQENLTIKYVDIYMKLIPFRLWKLSFINYFIDNATEDELSKQSRCLNLYTKKSSHL